MNYKKIKSEVLSLVVIITLICAFKSVFMENYTVPTGSMKPAIEPGDKLIVNKIAYDVRVPFTAIRLFEHSMPERGDVIVFDPPHDPSVPFVKRLIGLPGDLIEVEHGLIRVNGRPLAVSLSDESQLTDILENGGFYKETIGHKTYSVRRIPFTSRRAMAAVRVRVPKDHYFAVGDNRDESDDSRRWGFVPKQNILGKAKLIYFSFDWPSFAFHWERIGNRL